MFLDLESVQRAVTVRIMQREPDEERDPTLTFDWTEMHSPSVATVEAVAALRDRPVAGLAPLYGTVDTESLDALLDHQHGRDVEGQVSFEYHGHRVILSADGDARVYESVEGE